MLVNDFTATVITRIQANTIPIGMVQQVLDRDEDPDILAQNVAQLPTACVIPVGAGKLTASMMMGSSDMLEEFQQMIVVYYRQNVNNEAPYMDIDTLRGYAKALINLFSSNTRGSPFYRSFNGGVVYKATAEFHPYQAKDYLLSRMLVTLFVKGVEI